MTIAEEWMEEGYAKGFAKGILIGEIRQIQKFLKHPPSSVEKLRKKKKKTLKAKLAKLKERAAE